MAPQPSPETLLALPPTPENTLYLTTLAPSYLSSSAASRDTYSNWALHETLFYACIRGGDDRTASLALQRLSDRFGSDDDRVAGMRGVLSEVAATTTTELEEVLRGYDEVLEKDPTKLPIAKRRITLLITLSRHSEAILSLVKLLTSFPTDTESWGQLSALYFQAQLYEKALFCLEEIVLMIPNAYNIFARMAEISYKHAQHEYSGFATPAVVKALRDSVRYYSRSLELCDGYLRAFYGLKVVTRAVLGGEFGDVWSGEKKKRSVVPGGEEEVVMQGRKVLEGLEALATRKLGEIVGHTKAGTKGWQGYDLAEVAAAEELLGGEEQRVVR
ncbi:hypothetical protein BJ508DRAFT_228915 [Ascobolus immersus RN42]|uniref:ER membrane protein complex subunit 2 n=1 Tax=Ascobolus immersus RN42 TaxID=1160509 RepID=A0A3N4HZ74_ASCIM|nr:hypothetical protein BJ508DRAFT_228915 [Ascobolus immersus RN42]